VGVCLASICLRWIVPNLNRDPLSGFGLASSPMGLGDNHSDGSRGSRRLPQETRERRPSQSRHLMLHPMLESWVFGGGSPAARDFMAPSTCSPLEGRPQPGRLESTCPR
jgi:hypothetical protein